MSHGTTPKRLQTEGQNEAKQHSLAHLAADCIWRFDAQTNNQDLAVSMTKNAIQCNTACFAFPKILTSA